MFSEHKLNEISRLLGKNEMRNLHQEVTNRIVTELEAGTPLCIESRSQTSGLNIAAKNCPCSGVNVLLLWVAVGGHHGTMPRFLTFKQAMEAGETLKSVVEIAQAAERGRKC
jgi:antirestriction protein ArdC